MLNFTAAPKKKQKGGIVAFLRRKIFPKKAAKPEENEQPSSHTLTATSSSRQRSGFRPEKRVHFQSEPNLPAASTESTPVAYEDFQSRPLPSRNLPGEPPPRPPRQHEYMQTQPRTHLPSRPVGRRPLPDLPGHYAAAPERPRRGSAAFPAASYMSAWLQEQLYDSVEISDTSSEFEMASPYVPPYVPHRMESNTAGPARPLRHHRSLDNMMQDVCSPRHSAAQQQPYSAWNQYSSHHYQQEDMDDMISSVSQLPPYQPRPMPYLCPPVASGEHSGAACSTGAITSSSHGYNFELTRENLIRFEATALGSRSELHIAVPAVSTNSLNSITEQRRGQQIPEYLLNYEY